MITYSRVDRKDLGELKIAIRWENERKIYVSMIDLIYMTMISEEDFLDECRSQIILPNVDEVYLEVNEVIELLKRRNTLEDQRIIDWIENDIIPSVTVMPD